MKVAFACIVFLAFAACRQNTYQQMELWKESARLQSEIKVADIAIQLKQDCDSTIMQVARTRADSILLARKKKVTAKRK